MSISDRLAELGIVLPEAAPPVASYVPVSVHRDIAYISGQLPFVDGKLVTGQLGDALTVEEGVIAARACGLMVLAQLEAVTLLDNLHRIIKLNVFVNSTSQFVDQPRVANGASDLMFDIFGEPGKHARAAVGVAALPLNAAVEVDAVIALKEAR